MSNKEHIAAIERRLAIAGVSVAELCRRARVAQTTWHRWKTGAYEPRLATWRRIEAEVSALDHTCDAA